MDLSLTRLVKAGAPGPDNRRIYCNDDGVFIGPDCALIRAETDRAGRKSYKPRSRSEISHLLDAGYGFDLGLDGLMRSLNVVAKALDDGDMTLAQIAALQLRLLELADGTAANRMAVADRLLKAGFDPNEPRDSHGRWTTDESAGADPRTQLAQNTQSSATARSGPSKLIHLPGFPDSLSPLRDLKNRGLQLEIRQQDGYGSGYFNADRDHGRRKHLGVDLIAPPGTEVKSPVSGNITGIFDPYGRDPRKRGHLSAVQIATDDGYVVRLMYVKPGKLAAGQEVEAGDPLGTVQALSDVYPQKDPKDDRSGMINHVHFDIQREGTYLDPTPLVNAWQSAP